MKKTIGREIIITLVVPALIIIALMVLFLFSDIYSNAIESIELEIKGISGVAATAIDGNIENVKLSVKSAANMLEFIDPDAPNAREKCEAAVISMFTSDLIYNAWLAFEPNAFDGSDALHKDDYPGAPSGRFIRSYVKSGNKLIIAPDMDESILNDPQQCPWYISALNAEDIYVEVDESAVPVYDYHLEVVENPGCTITIAMPIKRGQEVIGSIGADMVFYGMDMGNYGDSLLAVFYPDGRLFYAPGRGYSADSIESLGFSSAESIMEAFRNRRDIFLHSENSAFHNGNTFAYFSPLKENLYMFAAIPYESAMQSTNILIVIGMLVFLTLLALSGSFSVYLVKRISNPIGKLIASANNIANGEMYGNILITTEADSAIKVLAQSLNTILEQFRTNLAEQKMAGEQFALYSYTTRFLHESKTLTDGFRAASAMFCGKLGLNKATIVYVKSGRPILNACYEAGYGFWPDGGDFIYHSPVSPLLADKDIVCLNSYTIALNKLLFLSEKTLYACIVPLRADRTDCGYIILESNDAKNNFTAYDESVYNYIANTLSQWISRKNKEMERINIPPENRAADYPQVIESAIKSEPAALDETPAENNEDEPESFLDSLKGIPELDTKGAVKAMGGLADVYESTFRVMIHMLPENIRKIDESLRETGDLNSFAIEVHGIKGALNNIGCRKLGAMAEKLEKAAKAEDREFCEKNFAGFRSKLLEFYENAKKAAGSPRPQKETGDVARLMESLNAVKEACEYFDATAATDTLSELAANTFPGGINELIESAIRSFEAFNYEDGLNFIEQIEKEADAYENNSR